MKTTQVLHAEQKENIHSLNVPTFTKEAFRLLINELKTIQSSHPRNDLQSNRVLRRILKLQNSKFKHHTLPDYKEESKANLPRRDVEIAIRDFANIEYDDIPIANTAVKSLNAIHSFNSVSSEQMPRRKDFTDSVVVQWVIPVFASTTETLQIFTGIMELDDLFEIIQLDNQPAKFVAAGSIGSAYFMTSLIINHKFIGEGLSSFKTILNLQIPDDRERWLSDKQFTLGENACAISSALFISIIASFNDGVSTTYFLNQRGLCIYGSAFIGALSGLATTASEGMEGYRVIRFFVARKSKRKYANNCNKYFSRLIGYPLAMFGAVEDIIDTYGAVAAMFAGESIPYNYVIFGMSFFNGFGNFFFEGQWTVDALNEFSNRLTRGRSNIPSLREVIAFLLSTLSAGLIAYGQQALASNMFKNPETELPFGNFSENVITFISYGIFFRELINNTYFNYEIYKECINRLVNRLNKMCGRGSNNNYKKLVQDEKWIEKNKRGTLIRHSMFSKPLLSAPSSYESKDESSLLPSSSNETEPGFSHHDIENAYSQIEPKSEKRKSFCPIKCVIM